MSLPLAAGAEAIRKPIGEEAASSLASNLKLDIAAETLDQLMDAVTEPSVAGTSMNEPIETQGQTNHEEPAVKEVDAQSTEEETSVQEVGTRAVSGRFVHTNTDLAIHEVFQYL